MSSAIPFFDVAAAYRSFRGEIDSAVRRVLESGLVVLGPEVEAFEAEFAAYVGARFAVGVASGTDAIVLAMRALGLGPADEVITVANAGIPPIAAICAIGARPRFVDVDHETLLLDPDAVAAAVTPATRALLAVHLYGQPLAMEQVRNAASLSGLPLIEDCAHAHGLRVAGVHAGTFGAIGCFSFYPTKNLGAFGDAGACVTDDPVLAESLRRLRVYGAAPDGTVAIPGLNSRLDELQATLLRVMLRGLDGRVARRRFLAAVYDDALRGAPVEPLRRANESDAYHLYVVRVPERQRYAAALAAAGIGCKVHYPIPAYQMPAFRDSRLGAGGLPETERACAEVLSLPLYPELEPGDVARVARVLRAV
jgi:dTDP-4-amino-4,6-dideoxygalactose transaminase